jgi:hypothetical protein
LLAVRSQGTHSRAIPLGIYILLLRPFYKQTPQNIPVAASTLSLHLRGATKINDCCGVNERESARCTIQAMILNGS